MRLEYIIYARLFYDLRYQRIITIYTIGNSDIDLNHRHYFVELKGENRFVCITSIEVN